MRQVLANVALAATLSLAIVPTVGLLSPANAAEVAEPSATISLVGLNLSNPADAAEFKARVDTAANRICRERARLNTSSDFTIAGCKSTAHKQAMRQLSKTQREGLVIASRTAPLNVAAR